MLITFFYAATHIFEAASTQYREPSPIMASQLNSQIPAATRSDFLCDDLLFLPTHKLEEPQCPICLELYTNHDYAVQVQNVSGCRHIYGRFCLGKWLENSNSCPMCRAKLFDLPPPKGLSPTQQVADWLSRLLHFPVDPPQGVQPSLPAILNSGIDTTDERLAEEECIERQHHSNRHHISSQALNTQYQRPIREVNRYRLAYNLSRVQQEESSSHIFHSAMQNINQEVIQLGERLTLVEHMAARIEALNARLAQIRISQENTTARIAEMLRQVNSFGHETNDSRNILVGSDGENDDWDGSTLRGSVADPNELRDDDVDTVIDDEEYGAELNLRRVQSRHARMTATRDHGAGEDQTLPEYMSTEAENVTSGTR